MAVTPTEFRAALRRLAAGVTVVTTRDAEGRPAGMTASAVTAASLAPPLVLVCVDRTATVHPALFAHGWFAVNLLRAEQAPLSRRFAVSGGDKFAGVAHREGRARLPVLEEALAALECRVVAAHAAGDHTIFVGEVEGARVAEGAPLVYCDGAYHRLDSSGGSPATGASARPE
jgi:flavin reductase ActVB